MTFTIDAYLRDVAVMEGQLSPIWPDGRFKPCMSGTGVHYHLPGRTRPVSVSRAEGRTLMYLAQECGAETAFEIGTAFGYSSLMISAGVRSVTANGWVCSLDAQLEGEIGDEGLVFAKLWRDQLGLQSVTHFVKGWSPTDVGDAVGDRKIDLAFIDGNHREEQPTVDFQALLPHLSDRAVIAWHDACAPYGVPAAIALAERFGYRTVAFNTSCRLAVSSLSKEALTAAERALHRGIASAEGRAFSA